MKKHLENLRQIFGKGTGQLVAFLDHNKVAKFKGAPHIVLRQKLLLLFGFIFLALNCCLPTLAHAESGPIVDPVAPFSGVKNIWLHAEFKQPAENQVAQDILEKYPSLRPESVEQAAKNNFQSRLKELKKSDINVYTRADIMDMEEEESESLKKRSTYYIVLNVSISSIEIIQEIRPVGTVSLIAYRYNPNYEDAPDPRYSTLYLPISPYGFPAEPFLVASTDEETAQNIKRAIKRVIRNQEFYH